MKLCWICPVQTRWRTGEARSTCLAKRRAGGQASHPASVDVDQNSTVFITTHLETGGRERVRSLESYCNRSCSFLDSSTLAAQLAKTPSLELQLVDRAAHVGGVHPASSNAPSNRAIGSTRACHPPLHVPCRQAIIRAVAFELPRGWYKVFVPIPESRFLLYSQSSKHFNLARLI